MKPWLYIGVLVLLLKPVHSIVPSVTFDHFELYLDTFNGVPHLELDKYDSACSNLLISSWPHLTSTSNSSSEHLISMLYSKGFTQLNRTHLVIVDSDDCCIRMLNREHRDLRTIAGTCDSRGYADGIVGVGKLLRPSDIVQDIRNPGFMLITDAGNNALRSVNLETGELTTVIDTGFNEPHGMHWNRKDLLVANKGFYISVVIWQSNGTVINKIVAGTATAGNTLGYFYAAEFIYPQELVKLQEDLFLVADSGNYQLKLLNLHTGVVGPVCFRNETTCTRSSNFRGNPISLLNLDDVIYIGCNHDIYRLYGSDLPCPYKNITVHLTLGEKTANVMLEGGHVFMGFTEGVHRVRKKYDLKMCTYYVNVIHHEEFSCPHKDITVYMPQGQNTAAVQLFDGTTKQFQKGTYRLSREYNSETCIYHVRVREIPQANNRRLVFHIHYNFSCDFLEYDTDVRNMLHRIMYLDQEKLQLLCGDRCQISNKIQPTYTCKERKYLSLFWVTEEFSSDEITRQVKEELSVRLTQSDTWDNSHIYFHPYLEFDVPAEKNSNGDAMLVDVAILCSDGKPRVHGANACEE